MAPYAPSNKAVIAAAYAMGKNFDQPYDEVIPKMAVAAIEVDYGVDWVSREQSDRVVAWAVEAYMVSMREIGRMV